MKYVILFKADSDKVWTLGVDETKPIYSELARIIDVPLVEIVKTQKMKSMTEDPETGEFMCMAIDDVGIYAENLIQNSLGSYLYNGPIYGDIVLCKYKVKPFEHVVEAFDSEEEAMEWLHKIK